MKLKSVVLLIQILLTVSSRAQDDWTKRDQWQNVEGIFRAMNLDSGSVAADIGCQDGYLTLKMAKQAGAAGTIYAVDIDQDALKDLKKNLKKDSVTNVTIIHSTTDNPMLPDGVLDAAVIVNAYHEMTEYVSMLAYIKKALKPGGRLVIVEPITDRLRKATRKEQTETHRIGSAFVKKDLENAGFRIDKIIEPFVQRVSRNDEMWLIVGIKE
ncbi:methyltransferase domain-containing protein [bacterium]|nr:methyltransferase domain-containing protein [bacterium]